MTGGGLLLIIAAVLTGEFGRLDLAAVSAKSIAGFLWLVVAGSKIAYTAYGYANATLPNDTVATYAYVKPVVAVMLGALLGQEALSPNLLLGGAVIVSAVVLIVGGKVVAQRISRRAPIPPHATRPIVEHQPPEGSTRSLGGQSRQRVGSSTIRRSR